MSLNYQISLHLDNFLFLHLNLVFEHIIIICPWNVRVFLWLRKVKGYIKKKEKWKRGERKIIMEERLKNEKLRTMLFIQTLNLLESRCPRPYSLLTYSGFQAKSPPLWHFFHLKKVGGGYRAPFLTFSRFRLKKGGGLKAPYILFGDNRLK